MLKRPRSTAILTTAVCAGYIFKLSISSVSMFRMTAAIDVKLPEKHFGKAHQRASQEPQPTFLLGAVFAFAMPHPHRYLVRSGMSRKSAAQVKKQFESNFQMP